MFYTIFVSTTTFYRETKEFLNFEIRLKTIDAVAKKELI